jgi:hypothetical protein
MRVSQPQGVSSNSGARWVLLMVCLSALLSGRATPDGCPPPLRAWLASRVALVRGSAASLVFPQTIGVREFAGIPLFGETCPKRKERYKEC